MKFLLLRFVVVVLHFNKTHPSPFFHSSQLVKAQSKQTKKRIRSESERKHWDKLKNLFWFMA
ncbi:CLUMA_CG010380, isoform A [Clunio marinus]|uniref:CLUMA_CG010380, isoform A n=1 Tax=Clunio marinus TaxID=568069 RepID=A0A1J1IBA1_9DIPT|nr:CLUMA_CG010380, isoform A [Clunio marinus]